MRYLPENVELNRQVSEGECRLTDLVVGLEDVPALGFLDDPEEFISDVEVIIRDGEGYMRVFADGTLHISLDYWQSEEDWCLYLDVIHELVHVKQAREGRDLYAGDSYIERKTEIEAYRVCVEEAGRMGLPEEKIREYLKVPWIDKEEYKRLLKKLDIKA